MVLYGCYIVSGDQLTGAPDHHTRRHCAYRVIVLWIYIDIQSKERWPLPSCVVLKVRATFPPTDNQEEFADWPFSGFVYGDRNMPDN